MRLTCAYYLSFGSGADGTPQNDHALTKASLLDLYEGIGHQSHREIPTNQMMITAAIRLTLLEDVLMLSIPQDQCFFRATVDHELKSRQARHDSHE